MTAVSFGTTVRSWGYELASKFTDPICKVREYIVKYQIVDQVDPHPGLKKVLHSLSLGSDSLVRLAEKAYLVAGIAVFAFLSPLGLPGIAIRALCSNLESEPFLHFRGTAKEKELEGKEISFVQWNICGIKGGYDVGEGGQLPLTEDLLLGEKSRRDLVVERLLSLDADVIELNELFDIQDFLYIADALKEKYAHMIGNCGGRAAGPNSGVALFSKYKAENISFTPFAKDTLVSGAKYCEKGVLRAGLVDTKGEVAEVFLTHLQHSEEPGLPLPLSPSAKEEIEGRKKQVAFLKELVISSSSKTKIIAGDLNMEERELAKADGEFYASFAKKTGKNQVPTWGGDNWYVKYSNGDSWLFGKAEYKRKPSTPVDLDHILVQGGTVHIEVLPTGYDPTSPPTRLSLSDHMIVCGKVQLS